jgi:hypothetical protein
MEPQMFGSVEETVMMGTVACCLRTGEAAAVQIVEKQALCGDGRDEELLGDVVVLEKYFLSDGGSQKEQIIWFEVSNEFRQEFVFLYLSDFKSACSRPDQETASCLLQCNGQ